MAQLIKAVIDTQKNSYRSIGQVNAADDLELELEVKMNGQPIEFINPQAELLMKKADNNRIRQTKDIIYEDGKFKIKVDEQGVTCTGIVVNQLTINDGGRISTCLFYFMVATSLDGEILKSISKVEVLEQLEEYIVTAFANLKDFEEKVLSSDETIRKLNYDMNESEKIRDTAELQRQETFKSLKENMNEAITNLESSINLSNMNEKERSEVFNSLKSNLESIKQDLINLNASVESEEEKRVQAEINRVNKALEIIEKLESTNNSVATAEAERVTVFNDIKSELTSLKEALTTINNTANSNEEVRKENEVGRVAAEQQRQDNFNSMKLENDNFKKGINEQYEDIATEFDKVIANVTNGNESATNSEIVQARGKEVNLNARLDNFDEQLDTKAKQLDKKIDEVAQTGTTIEIVQNKVSEMAQNGSITFNTVTPEMTTFIENIGAKNLYKNIGYIDNKRVNDIGQLVDWNYCFTLELFEVKPNTTYSFSVDNGKTAFSIKYLVEKEHKYLDDFRLTAYHTEVSSITTNEKTLYLGISIEKNILASNGGNYETIDDFLKDFIIQESETNEEIQGYSMREIQIPYLDREVDYIKEKIDSNNSKVQIANLSSNKLYIEPITQFSNGYCNWEVTNKGYNIPQGSIYSMSAEEEIAEEIKITGLDAWDTIDSFGKYNNCTKEVELANLDFWRNEINDGTEAINFGVWMNIPNIEKGNVGQGENATFKINTDTFEKTYGNVKSNNNTMAYGNYTDGLGQPLYVSVLKSNLATEDVAGLKQYLGDNNIKIKVKLIDNFKTVEAEPILVKENGYIYSSDGLEVKASQNGIKKSNLHGKIGMSLGDSLSALGVWQELVSEDLGIKSWVNLAVGGQRVSKFAENVTSENLKDVDFVTVMGYFNSYDCPAGSSEDLASNGDTDSIWSNYKYIINKLKTLKPSVDIIIMSAHKPAPPNNTDSRAELVKQIAKYYSLPFIDIHNDGGFNEYTYSIYMYEDKIHSTDLGYEKEAKLISGELRRIFG
ncbi:GDSL-type esterase/lipase family protein [uncultured Clostridium sp.]|uniref:GDSL-type esterase/lipase family protein n=1 Tax=uncultured Clostridium sp. TaxID=59620 RepID=UPI0025E64706|nr:GDSL-type esterase/lipase family protein [uncultured Clostridium sp.]